MITIVFLFYLFNQFKPVLFHQISNYFVCSNEIVPKDFRYRLFRLRADSSKSAATLDEKSQYLVDLTNKMRKIQEPYEKNSKIPLIKCSISQRFHLILFRIQMAT